MFVLPSQKNPPYHGASGILKCKFTFHSLTNFCVSSAVKFVPLSVIMSSGEPLLETILLKLFKNAEGFRVTSNTTPLEAAQVYNTTFPRLV